MSKVQEHNKIDSYTKPQASIFSNMDTNNAESSVVYLLQ